MSTAVWPCSATTNDIVDGWVHARADFLTTAYPDDADCIAANLAAWAGPSAAEALLDFAHSQGRETWDVIDQCLRGCADCSASWKCYA